MRSTVAIGDVLGYFTFKMVTNLTDAAQAMDTLVFGLVKRPLPRPDQVMRFVFTREVETNVDGFALMLYPL